MESKPSQVSKISTEQEDSRLKKELTPEEKEITHSLESLSFLLKKDRVFLVLVWRGLKTASPVSIQGGAQESMALEKILKEAGILFKKDRIIKEKMRGLEPGQIYFVANNQKDLDLISDKWFGDHDNDPKIYRELGRMSGFPPTAIDAYERISKAGILNLPDKEKDRALEDYIFTSLEKRNYLMEKREFGAIPFSQLFYMSKEHWKDEMEIPRKWAKEVELVTPALYKEFTASYFRSVDFIQELKGAYHKRKE